MNAPIRLVTLPRSAISPNGKVQLWDCGPTAPKAAKDSPAYLAYEKERAEFQGPVRIELWTIDARHALGVDPTRYSLQLPAGMKPGPAEAERIAGISIQMEADDRQVGADPHFAA
jgi:hypothetical protein